MFRFSRHQQLVNVESEKLREQQQQQLREQQQQQLRAQQQQMYYINVNFMVYLLNIFERNQLYNYTLENIKNIINNDEETLNNLLSFINIHKQLSFIDYYAVYFDDKDELLLIFDDLDSIDNLQTYRQSIINSQANFSDISQNVLKLFEENTENKLQEKCILLKSIDNIFFLLNKYIQNKSIKSISPNFLDFIAMIIDDYKNLVDGNLPQELNELQELLEKFANQVKNYSNTNPPRIKIYGDEGRQLLSGEIITQYNSLYYSNQPQQGGKNKKAKRVIKRLKSYN